MTEKLSAVSSVAQIVRLLIGTMTQLLLCASRVSPASYKESIQKICKRYIFSQTESAINGNWKWMEFLGRAFFTKLEQRCRLRQLENNITV